jgi:hypothetical protein
VPTYRDEDVVETLLADAAGADVSREEGDKILQQILHTNFPGITNDQAARCLTTALEESRRREKQAAATAERFAEVIKQEMAGLDVNRLREVVEFFIYAHHGRAPTDVTELAVWMEQETRSGKLTFHPIH